MNNSMVELVEVKPQERKLRQKYRLAMPMQETISDYVTKTFSLDSKDPEEHPFFQDPNLLTKVNRHLHEAEIIEPELIMINSKSLVFFTVSSLKKLIQVF